MEKVLERTNRLESRLKVLDMEINFEEHMVRQNGREILLLRIKYELLAAALCFSAAGALRKYGRRDYFID